MKVRVFCFNWWFLLIRFFLIRLVECVSLFFLSILFYVFVSFSFLHMANFLSFEIVMLCEICAVHWCLSTFYGNKHVTENKFIHCAFQKAIFKTKQTEISEKQSIAVNFVKIFKIIMCRADFMLLLLLCCWVYVASTLFNIENFRFLSRC